MPETRNKMPSTLELRGGNRYNARNRYTLSWYTPCHKLLHMRKITYIAIALVLLGFGVFLIRPYLQTYVNKAKETAMTQALADGTSSVSARYAHMMLQAIPLRQGDCFVCSADGFPPDESMIGGMVDAALMHSI